MQWGGSRSYEELRHTFQWDVPPSFNIGVACADAQRAEKPALIEVGSTGEPRIFTFGDVRSLSNRLANALIGRGVAPGDRVAIVVPQSIETAVAHIATYKLGAIALPLSILFGPDALSFRLKDAGAKAVVVSADIVPKLDSVRDELPELKTVVVVGATGEGRDRDVVSFDDAIDSASAEFSARATASDDSALLIYTSGTTGPPKGALHAHRVLLGHLPGFELSHEFFPQDGDCFWTPADWAWIGGLLDALLPSWFHGIPVIASTRERFDPEWAFDIIRKYGIRNMFLPPTALKLMRAATPPDTPISLRTIGSGGEPLGEEMLAWGRETLGVTINEFYGQTEVNLVVGNCSPAWEVRAGSMGRPYPGHDVELIDGSGEPVPEGEPGEVAVRAPDPVMFLGYWNRPDATEAKFTGAWARTGDSAVKDADGYLWFQGRNDDIISSAGYRIGPGEIEECLIGHDAVAMAAVIGVPDDLRGEVVKAFLVLRQEVEPSGELEDEIRAHVRERLAAYEYPRKIEFVDDLPMTTTGKIQRMELRRREHDKLSG